MQPPIMLQSGPAPQTVQALQRSFPDGGLITCVTEWVRACAIAKLRLSPGLMFIVISCGLCRCLLVSVSRPDLLSIPAGLDVLVLCRVAAAQQSAS